MFSFNVFLATLQESRYDGETSLGNFDLSVARLNFTKRRNAPNTTTIIGTTNCAKTNRLLRLPLSRSNPTNASIPANATAHSTHQFKIASRNRLATTPKAP